MLELDDIQHFLLTRPRAMAARYGFLTIRNAAEGRAWLSGIIEGGDRQGGRGGRCGGYSLGDRRIYVERATRARGR